VTGRINQVTIVNRFGIERGEAHQTPSKNRGWKAGCKGAKGVDHFAGNKTKNKQTKTVAQRRGGEGFRPPPPPPLLPHNKKKGLRPLSFLFRFSKTVHKKDGVSTTAPFYRTTKRASATFLAVSALEKNSAQRRASAPPSITKQKKGFDHFFSCYSLPKRNSAQRGASAPAF